MKRAVGWFAWAPVVTLAAVGGCSTARDPAGSSEGTLVVYVATYDDGHSTRQYGLRGADGSETPLVFDTAPQASSGDAIRVWGNSASDGIHVTDYEEAVTNRVESAITTYPAPATDTYAFVLVDLGGGVDVTATQAQTAMFGTGATDKSFAEYYAESSHGKYTVTGDVVGPYTYTMTTCDTTGMYQAIESQIPKTYNHYIYYFGQQQSVCQWGGLGEEGSSQRPAKRTWINGSDGCVVLMQEPGHNLGLMHGNTLACPGASFSSTPASSCTVTEYGNSYTTMGHGCRTNNAYEKWYEGWLTGCNGVRVTQTGTFNLLPLEPTCAGGIQVLQVPMPSTRTITDPQATTTNVNLNDYYVELRESSGTFDNGLTGPVVLVYASDNVRTSANQDSVWTELLDMNPTTTKTFDPLAVGQTFTDPSGSPSITLNSLTSGVASVTVTVTNGTGGPTCIDGTTLSGQGPASCSGGTTTGDAGAADAATPRDAGSVDASMGGGGNDASAPMDASKSTFQDAATADGSRAASDASAADAAANAADDSGGAGGTDARAADAQADARGAGSSSSSSNSSSEGDAETTGGGDGASGSSSKGCACSSAGHESGGNAPAAVAALAFAFGARRRRRPAAKA